MTLETTKQMRLDGGVSSPTHNIIANVEIIANTLRIVTKLGDEIIDNSPLIDLGNQEIERIAWTDIEGFGWVYGFSCVIMLNDNSTYVYTKSWENGSSYNYSKFLKVGESYELFDNDGSENWGEKVVGGFQTFLGAFFSTNCHGNWLNGSFIDSDKNIQSVRFLTPSRNVIKTHLK